MYLMPVIMLLLSLGIVIFIAWDMWRMGRKERELKELKKINRVLEEMRKLAETDEKVMELLKREGLL